MVKRMDCRKRSKNLIKSADIYGRQMSLTYKNHSSSQTLLGGVFTLASKIFIICYLALKLQDVINKKSEIRISTSFRDLNHDMTEYTFSDGKFDVGIQASFTNTSHPDFKYIDSNIDEYVTLQIRHIYTKWVEQNGEPFLNITTKFFALEICTPDRFNGIPQATFQGIIGGYYCPQGLGNYSVQGAKYSNEKRNLIITADKCNQKVLTSRNSSKKCKSPAEIEDVVNSVLVQIAMLNQGFDSNIINAHPITEKILLETLTLSSTVSQRQVYILKRNEVLISDNPLTSSLGTVNMTYYETAFRATTINNPNYGFSLLDFKLGMNDQVVLTERTAYTIFDALSEVGGLSQAITIIIGFLIGNLQDQIFFKSIIKRIFLYDDTSQFGFSMMSNKSNMSRIHNDEESKDDSYQQSQRKLKKGFEFTPDTAENKVRPLDDSHQLNQHDKTLLQILKDTVTSRKVLTYSLMQYMKSRLFKMLKLCRVKMTQKDQHRELFYQDGVKKLREEFDIVKLFRSLRKVELLSDIILSTHQKQLLPYFKQNLLHYESKDKFLKLLTSKFENISVDDCLLQTVKRANTSKVDKRIIKNLIDYQLFEMPEENDQKGSQQQKQKKKKKKRSTQLSNTNL